MAPPAPCRDLRLGPDRGARSGPSRSRRPRIPLLCLLLSPGDHPRACSAWPPRPRSSLSGRSTPISTPIRSPAARFRHRGSGRIARRVRDRHAQSGVSVPRRRRTALPRCPGGGGSPRDRSGVPAVPVPRDPLSPRLPPARGSRRGGERHDPRPLGRCSPARTRRRWRRSRRPDPTRPRGLRSRLGRGHRAGGGRATVGAGCRGPEWGRRRSLAEDGMVPGVSRPSRRRGGSGRARTG